LVHRPQLFVVSLVLQERPSGENVSAMPASQARRGLSPHTRAFAELKCEYLNLPTLQLCSLGRFGQHTMDRRGDLCYPFLSGDRPEARPVLSSVVFNLPVEGRVADAID
jgi:hypothetical protein